ncbi:MAG TPA: HK97 family phage prohead protease [Gemmatimonadales bacterium]|nr:HK97 family phage prohead protease [Gemmatimonadales bacterium]
MERLQAAFTVQEPIGDHGTFAGLAAVFGREFPTEMGPTIIERGAFAESLKQRSQVPILWQHDDREPIGLATELRETDEGLAIRGLISETARGKDARVLLRDQVVRDLSIGFDKREAQQGIPRRLKVLDLYEVSLVTWGAAGPIGARVREVNRAATAPKLVATNELLNILAERSGYGDLLKIPVEQLERICPSCGEKLRAMGITAVSRKELHRALETLQMNDGMCQRVGAGDEGFFGRCTEMDWEGIDDKQAFCAALHTFCVGKPPGAE